jgi:hypothetical protein
LPGSGKRLAIEPVTAPVFAGLRQYAGLFSIATCHKHFKGCAMQINKWGGLLALAATLAMSACGGGGGGSGSTVTGVAATGAAITSGAVTLKCATGTSYSTTTGVDGKFSVDVANADLPCLAQVSYVDSAGVTQKLRTIIKTAGNANITPVTELVVAKLTGGKASTAFDTLDAAKLKAYTSADITAAIAAVKTYIAGLGVAVTNFPTDPIGSAFVPARSGVSGDAVDAMLDAFKAKLGSTTLDQAATAVSGGNANAGGTGMGTVTVSNASNAVRNGDYAVTGSTFTDAAKGELAINGNTTDGNFEMEVVWNATTKVIKRAHIWYFISGTPKFFGCDGGAIPCSNVGYEPIGPRIILNTSAVWQEVGALSGSNGTDTLVPGGESLKVGAILNIP